MATVRYTTLNGEIVAEKRSGARRLYQPDPLGSTVGLIDSTQTQTDTFSYWPFGEERARTGSTPTPFRFVGTAGYYRNSATRSYVRARELDVPRGRWLTRDPLPGTEALTHAYPYANARPVTLTDRNGLFPQIFNCRPEDEAALRNVIGVMCSGIGAGAGIVYVGDVESCICAAGRGELGPRQEGCILNWCSVGCVVCNYRANCCSSSAPTGPAACAPIGAGSHGCVTICASRGISNGHWNPSYGCHGVPNPPYIGCDSPKCQGREGIFYMLHELQHLCGTRREENAEAKACCYLKSYF
jgi:RHS repeat-associated protein